MRTKKTFYVIAYDIKSNKRRRKIAKTVEKFGGRINLSVFECMVDMIQLKELLEKIDEIIDKSEDQIAIFPLCLECFTKVIYLPEVTRKADVVLVK